MDTIKELASTNMKISEAKNILFKLQEDETVYLEEREKKAIDKIQTILDESKDLLDQTHSNYEEVHQLCQMVSSFTEFLSEAHGKFSDMLETFQLRSDEWDAKVKKQEEEFAEIRKGIKVQQSHIENDKKTIAKNFKKIEEEKALISSRQQQIKVALQVLEKKQNG